MITSLDIEDFIREALETVDVDEEYNIIESIMIYEDAGILTDNRGLVITTTDGEEFQVTIVKSK